MKQREARQSVSLPARVRWDGRWLPASVHNISSRGLLLRLRSPPAPGTYVEVEIGTLILAARTIWAGANSCGMYAQERFDLSGLGDARSVAIARRPAVTEPPRQRASDFRQQEERSRQISSLIQYATFVALAVAAASSIATEVYRTMSAPTESLVTAFDVDQPAN